MTPYIKYFVLEITLIFSGREKFSGFIFYAANLVTSSSLGHITEDDATEKPLPFILVMSLSRFFSFFSRKIFAASFFEV